MKVISQLEDVKKVKLEEIEDGGCFYDSDCIGDNNKEYSIKTNRVNKETGQIMTVNLFSGDCYYENSQVMIVPVRAKVIIEN